MVHFEAKQPKHPGNVRQPKQLQGWYLNACYCDQLGAFNPFRTSHMGIIISRNRTNCWLAMILCKCSFLVPPSNIARHSPEVAVHFLVCTNVRDLRNFTQVTRGAEMVLSAGWYPKHNGERYHVTSFLFDESHQPGMIDIPTPKLAPFLPSSSWCWLCTSKKKWLKSIWQLVSRCGLSHSNVLKLISSN